MKVKELIEVLEKNKGKALKFEYKKGQFVEANYHLTEVKNVLFNTTDCGGNTNNWQETHLQLWENPTEHGKTAYMTTDKIMSILKRVDSISPLLLETALKVEYGNLSFHTSVMPVQQVNVYHKSVELALYEERARCKANDVCGYDVHEVQEESCCQAVACC